MSPEDPTTPTLLDCPECGLPAEATDRFVLEGEPRPVEHVKLVCVAGHWFTPPVDLLPVADQHLLTAPEIAQTEASAIRRSPAHRLMTPLKEVWDELDYAQRRTLELQAGMSLRRER